MRRLLSLILAITMIAVLIPAAFAADGETASYKASVPVTYTLNYGGREKSTTSGYFESYKSDGNCVKNCTEFIVSNDPDSAWAYIGTNAKKTVSELNYVYASWKSNSTNGFGGVTRIKVTDVGDYVAFQIKVPETGIYKVTEMKSLRDYRSISDMAVYILPANAKVSVNGFDGTLLDAFSDSRVYGTVTVADSTATRSDAPTFVKFNFTDIAKEDYLVVSGANLLKSGVSTSDAVCEEIAFTSEKELLLEAETPYVLLFCVNTSPSGKDELKVHSLTLTPVNELSGEIAFAAGADIQYKVGDGAYTSINANSTVQIPVASTVTVKVTDTENFAGWVRGTADSGVWVSGDPEYPFNIMSPTYLTPVYTTPDESATYAVEFWDENGAYVDTVTATNGKAVLPDKSKYGLVGGTFSGWWLNATTQLLEGDEVAEGITRAVAKYNYVDFGTTVANKNDSATYWKRGDDIVAYGSSYDFYQWSGAPTITAGTLNVEKNPLVVIDSTPVDGAYMIEYDKGNATAIVEAGILFGSDTDIVIGSTDGSKAASQRNGDDTGHGQFCAKPNSNEAYARGYLIYRGTDDKLYVIYTAAVNTTAAAE